MRALTVLFWLSLAALSTTTVLRVSDEYLSTVNSLQDFQWAVVQFDVPTASAERTSLVVEIQNQSRLDLDMKDLEVFLWLGDTTVGKTYGRFEPHTVRRGVAERIPLVIELTPAYLRDALGKLVGAPIWRATGSYKVSTPLTGSDFVFHLGLDVPS